MSTDAQSTLDLGLVSILNEKFGISDFFPVQEAVVSFLKDEKNRDLCVSAPTGSGKTLSYVLPIVDAIKDRFLQRLQAIVIVPTKDLVSQVKEAFMPFCRSLGLKAAAFNGSLSFKEEQKLLGDADVLASRSEYSCHIDILVTTPNRLVDHFASTRGFDLLHVRFVVFDEADRLFGEPSRTWYDLLADRLRRPEASPLDFAQPFRFPLQRLLFSATLSRNEAKYSELKLHNPHVIHISPVKYSTPSTLREFYAIASDTQKGALLIYLLTVEFQSKKILCFTNSVSATEKLGYLISQLPAVSTIATFSGDKGIQERNRIIAGFNSGTIRALSRGLDLANVDCVINFELPTSIKTYMHRVGRTARAGKPGVAISFSTESEYDSFYKMLDSAGKGDGVLAFPVQRPEAVQELTEKLEVLLQSSVSQQVLLVRQFLLRQLKK